MLERMKKIIITVLAVFGVLFLILLLIPSDDEEEDNTVEVEETDTSRDEDRDEDIEGRDEDREGRENGEDREGQETSKDRESEEGTSSRKEDQGDFWAEVEPPKEEEEESSEEAKDEDKAQVSIPSGDISDYALRFTTTDLDNEAVNQDIFSEHDITVVHLWGTFCGPCIEEMDEYASFYESKPDNVGLLGIIVDVYDGVDTNADDAYGILSDAGAHFLNLRTSDSNYDIVSRFQYVPSSFLVDREGRVVGEMMDGASYWDTMKALDRYLK